MIIIAIIDKIQNATFFFFCSFGVRKALNKNIINAIVSTNTNAEKTIKTTCAIKAFISFKLIQRLVKNLTSSTV
ncbi:MAG: hypothetical protein LBF15_01455 [Candidatus Peribacteria bacterium]|nr:hypothetical protein [Candidatus Peribacteria bacterium]